MLLYLKFEYRFSKWTFINVYIYLLGVLIWLCWDHSWLSAQVLLLTTNPILVVDQSGMDKHRTKCLNPYIISQDLTKII